MGICPCKRDQNSDLLAGAQRIVPDQDCSRASSNSLIKTVATLSSLYKVLSPLDASWRLLRGESLESRRACLIRILPKPVRTLTRISTAFETLVKLDHPSLLKTYDVFQDDGSLYIVTEPFEGGDLEDMLQSKGFLPEKTAALIMHQILTALTRCHQAGIVHRGLDLQSLVFKEQPTEDKLVVKIRGWENFEVMVEAGEPAFSWFMAPELITGDFSAKSDIWSCGVILYMLLSGRPPFGTSKPTQARLKVKSLSFPHSIWSHVRRDAIDLIMLMLDERPDVRPSALQCLAHQWIRHFSRIRSLSSRQGRPSSADLRSNGASIRKGVLLFMMIRTIPENDLTHFSSAFNFLDKDGDGFISPQELLAGLTDALGKEHASAEVARVSASTGGRISFSEYLLSICDVEGLVSHDKMRIAFDSLNKNPAGNVSLVDLKLLLRVNPAAETQWKGLISDLETQDDALSFSDFEALIIKALKG